MHTKPTPDTHHRAIDALAAHGVWSPALVPLRPDLRIDVERFVAHARWLQAQGCHGVAVFGTTGEANSFSIAERRELVEATVADGLRSERLMIGTGCCALTDSVELTRHALDIGCRRVLMLPPFYYKQMSEAGLFRSYAEIIERVGNPGLKVLLYHIPQLSGVPITTGLIARLTDAFPEVIAGVKDSSGDWSNTQALLERFPDLAIFPGSEAFLLDGLRAGAAGCITAAANVNAAGVRAIFDAWDADGDAAGAQQAATAIRRIIEQHPWIPAQKYLLAHYRNDPAWGTVRPPMVTLNADAGSALRAALTNIGFGGERLATL